MRLRIFVCVMAAFGLMAMNAVSEDQKALPQNASGIGFEFKIRYGFANAGPGAVTLDDIPVSLRTVPTHAGDAWFARPGTPRPIPYPSFTVGDPKVNENFSFGIAPQYTIGRVTFRAGANIQAKQEYRSQMPEAGNFDSYRAINQYGKPERGIGTSLVYYGAYWTDTTPVASPFGEVELRLHRYVSVFGGFGASRSRLDLTLENGYDRWNALETYSTTKVASITSQTAQYGGIRIGNPYVGVSVGAGPYSTKVRSDYAAMRINTPEGNRMRVFVSVDLRLTKTKPAK